MFGLKKKTGSIKKKDKDKDKEKDKERLFLQESHLSTTLVKGDIRKLVVLPKFVEKEEWLAINTFDFFHHVNLFYGTVVDHCTAKSCPIMSAGECEYLWGDERKYSQYSAPQYIDSAMTWIHNQIDDEAVFPTEAGGVFPKDLEAIIKIIFKRLFRVLVHIYYEHFDVIIQLQEVAHLNTLFTHFILFANEFSLIDKKEYAPLNDLIIPLVGKEHADQS